MMNHRIYSIPQLQIRRPPPLIGRYGRVANHLHTYIQPAVRGADAVQCHGGGPAGVCGEVNSYDESEAIGRLEDRVVYCIVWRKIESNTSILEKGYIDIICSIIQ